jgi:hypothetical protein
LACKDIFTETEPGTFALTPMAEFLRSDHPFSLKDAYPLIQADIEAWAHLDYSVRTGKSAFEHVHGCDYWQYMQQHPEQAARFDRAQQAQTRLELKVFLRAYDWGALRTLVDVGGGNGAFLGGVLARHSEMHGILFDQPQVIAGATEVLRNLGVLQRCEIVGGDFFHAVPANADCYLLKRVLYGWHEEEAATLLNAVRSAMRPDSRLLVIEPVNEPHGESDISSRFDLAMLVMKGSGARTLDEISELCGKFGLRRTARTQTLMFPLIEFRPLN